MKNDRINQLTWRSQGALQIATDMSCTFKIDQTGGRILLSLSDQLEEYFIGNCKSVGNAKRKANEKRWALLKRDDGAQPTP